MKGEIKEEGTVVVKELEGTGAVMFLDAKRKIGKEMDANTRDTQAVCPVGEDNSLEWHQRDAVRGRLYNE